ncbi:lipid A 4'-phosphatase [Inquilinus ginsengisoli]|uniref:Lipid A 4'-phosphatase n=1 Tax=Inquilinus ginsengisoli TaxID=363840 RepID=A0ABU1JW38_9PROT|nr:phosphatase PAP2 family protein [Inquilinus ginsengisoli]MDR6292826.1 lipid A 4'-phosphatase [Inquilinus ginsengisoli]
MTPRVALWLAVAVCAVLVLLPGIDLVVAGWFYAAGSGFAWDGAPLAEAIHQAVQFAARAGAALLLAAAAWTWLRPARLLGLDARRWTFLLLALAIGPGLVANAVLKDHWGRARPRQVEAFGGAAAFSPPLIPAGQCSRNCSFVAGDPTVGFVVHSVAYVVPRRRRRPIFWGSMALGGAIGLLRIGMGGHFLSDVVFAAAVTLLVSAGLHALLFDRWTTAAAWRDFTRGLVRWPQPS